MKKTIEQILMYSMSMMLGIVLFLTVVPSSITSNLFINANATTTIYETEYNDDMLNADLIYNETAPEAFYKITGIVGSDSDKDVFRFTLHNRSAFNSTAYWTGNVYDYGWEDDLLLGLFDSNGTILYEYNLAYDANGYIGARQLQTTLNPGTYYLLVVNSGLYPGLYIGEYYGVWVDFTPVTKIAKPSSVTATSAGSTTLNVSWTASPGVAGYEVFYAPTMSGPSEMIEAGNATSTTIDGLQPNTNYYVRVRAYNYMEYSDMTSWVSVKTAPAIPTGLNVVTGGYDALDLSWTASAGATGYQVYGRKTTDTNFTLIQTLAGTSFHHSGLTAGTVYEYKVRAYRTDGAVNAFSDYSDVVSGVPEISIPSGVSAESTKYDTLTVKWNAVAGAGGYEVVRSQTSTGEYVLAGTSTTNQFADSELDFNAGYYYKVRAYVMVGSTKTYSDYSDYIYQYTSLSKVNGFSVISSPFNTNFLKWTAIEGATGYEIYHYEGEYHGYSFLAETTSPEYQHNNVTNGTEYGYYVMAYRFVGDQRVYGMDSDIKIVTPEATVPLPIAVSSSVTSIQVSWKAVAGVDGYQVYRGFNETGSFALVNTTTATSYLNSNLTTNRSYFYKVRAYAVIDGVTNYTNFSPVVYAKPIPAAPTSIDVVAVNSSSMQITWAPVEGATGYQLFRSFGPTGTFTLAGSTTTNSYLNTGLTLNRTYFYRVRAYTMVGTTRVVGPYSTIDNAKPIPAAATSILASSGGFDRINLSWTPAVGAGGYTIYRATSLTGTYSIVGNVTTSNFINTGLGFNTTYYYKVRSFYMVNGVKNYGMMSEPVNAKTILSTPTISSSNLTSTSIKLTWGAIAGASGYEVYRSTTSTGTYALQSTVATNTYSKTALVKGTVYYYKVRAYRLVGTTKVFGDFSAPKYVKVGY